MEFTLTFRGSLPPSATREKRVIEKHQIREQLRVQLACLWEREAPLQYAMKHGLPEAQIEKQHLALPPDGSAAYSMHCWARLGPYKFVPLITKPNKLACRLDIKFLRHGHPGDLITDTGDLDNRLKVLFDALRMPLCEDELPQNASPIRDEYFFCLLEDDSLIQGFRVDAKQLLRPLNQRFEVELLVDVVVKTTVVTGGSIAYT